MHPDPIQALRAASRPSRPTQPCAPRPATLVAGATGVLGNEMLRRLAGSPAFGQARVLAREPMRDGVRGLTTLQVPGGPVDAWPPLGGSEGGAGHLDAAASTGVIMFEPPRLFHDRERALWTPQPGELVALARWMRAGGVTTLAVVLPHAQGRLPEALKRGLAGLDELAVAALGFERLIFVRSAQKPAAARAGSLGQRMANGMLGVLRFMVPASEQPVRAVKVAELVALALQLAPPGIHVAAPELVWRAAQGNAGHMRLAAAQWLGT